MLIRKSVNPYVNYVMAMSNDIIDADQHDGHADDIIDGQLFNHDNNVLVLGKLTWLDPVGMRPPTEGSNFSVNNLWN
jgi:hypothetical protein